MRLLLVEDSSRLQRSLTLGLRKSGYVVDTSADGLDALWQAQSVEYDVIILDIMIPSLDGLGVLEKLREGGNKTHVLLLTARDTVDDRVKGLQMGADDYLVKPFAFAELLARVQALARRSYAHKSPLVEIKDLVINLATQRVSAQGRNIELLPREFRLLRFLALRRGEVVSRTDIEAHLYDEQTEVMSNAVDSTVCQLRKKLQQGGSGMLIHTRRGLGYCIDEEISTK